MKTEIRLFANSNNTDCFIMFYFLIVDTPKTNIVLSNVAVNFELFPNFSKNASDVSWSVLGFGIMLFCLSICLFFFFS